jgi:hypothetical protein
VTRLWDTYLAEGDALPDFLVYIFASFLLTVRILLLGFMFQSTTSIMLILFLVLVKMIDGFSI